MHKILFAIFLLIILLFPKSEVFADNPKCTPIYICKDGHVNRDDGSKCQRFVPGIGTKTEDPIPTIVKDMSCPTGTYPNSDQVGSCNCIGDASKAVGAANPQTGAIVDRNTAAGCKTDASGKNDCSSAKGQRCQPGASGPTTDGPGVMTAIGCIPSEPQALVEGLLKYGTLAAGGIAFLIMLLAAIQMITAEGNPESIKHAQERFYSAIIGLLLIIFAVLLMQVIGYNILGLPGFGSA